jgi:hypothetical protein
LSCLCSTNRPRHELHRRNASALSDAAARPRLSQSERRRWDADVCDNKKIWGFVWWGLLVCGWGGSPLLSETKCQSAAASIILRANRRPARKSRQCLTRPTSASTELPVACLCVGPWKRAAAEYSQEHHGHRKQDVEPRRCGVASVP